MKLSFGKILFTDDLALDEEEVGDPPVLTSVQPGVRKKFTFLGVGLVVSGILIPTKSFEDSSEAPEGISGKRLCRFQS